MHNGASFDQMPSYAYEMEPRRFYETFNDWYTKQRNRLMTYPTVSKIWHSDLFSLIVKYFPAGSTSVQLMCKA
jgi:hypothetical protein